MTTVPPAAASSREVAADRVGFLLEARGIWKRFGGVPALGGAHFRLRHGSVHALCGVNGAGKSTLLSILMGLQARDAGKVFLRGREVHFATPKQALAQGIAIITQELSPVLDMDVAENIFLGREPKRLGVFVNRQRLDAMTRELLGRLNFDLDPHAMMRGLSLAQVQLVEIAKAISHDSEVLIMDEPTSALGEAETRKLFDTIRLLVGQGKSVVYVSHRMKEIFANAEEFTVIRDGRSVAAGRVADTDRRGLIQHILGGDLEHEFVKENVPSDEVLLSVRGLSRRGKFEDVNLDVRRGEILGIYGLMGSGRSEFFECLFGLDRADAGEIKINGEPVRIAAPADAVRHGLALVTEDRKASGLVMTGTVKENISLSSLDDVTNLSFINARQERHRVGDMIGRLSIRTPSPDAPVRTMSGGNQQKVVLSRWMLTEPSILLLDEPTRGVDVGSKRQIYQFMSECACRNLAVVMVSSEIPEVLGMSDKVVIFRRGRVAGEIARGDAAQADLLHLAS